MREYALDEDVVVVGEKNPWFRYPGKVVSVKRLWNGEQEILVRFQEIGSYYERFIEAKELRPIPEEVSGAAEAFEKTMHETVERYENDLAALDVLLRLAEAVGEDSSLWIFGAAGVDKSAVIAWLKEQAGATLNTLDALNGTGMPTPDADSLPAMSIARYAEVAMRNAADTIEALGRSSEVVHSLRVAAAEVVAAAETFSAKGA